MKSKTWMMALVRLATLSLAVASCGGGGGGGGVSTEGGGGGGSTEGETLVTLSSVTALYPNNGANWNDYVKGKTIATATDALCTAATDTACIHGGEVRVVTVTGKTSCSGLTASDALGAFDWTCDASTGMARMISAGLKDGKFLSDLIDFTTPAWKANSVTVNNNGTLYSTQSSTTWWANSVTTANSGGSLAASGTVYAITTSVTGTYTIDASKVALVSKPGVTIQGATAAGETIISASNVNFIWLEGTINVIGNNLGAYLDTVKYSSLRNVKADNANTGTYLAGVVLNASDSNVLKNISGSNNVQNGMELSSSSNNILSDITAVNNGRNGIGLVASSYNILNRVRTANNLANGIKLVNSSNHNALIDISASNNEYYGVDLYQTCYNNLLSKVVAANNGWGGVALEMSSNSNVLGNITVSGNQSVALYLNESHHNTLHSVTTTNNSGDGLYTYTSSTNNLVAVMASNNGGVGIGMAFNSGSTLDSVASANNGLYGIYMVTSSSNTIKGILKVGNNTSADCVVSGGTDPGLNGSCVDIDGVNDTVLTTGISLSISFVGKVTADDTTNMIDSSGTATYVTDPSLFDWFGFQSQYRAWGKDGSAFPNADNRGRWTTGTGRIWDWSLSSTDMVIRNVLSVPTGNDTLTHTWSDASTTTFLKYAIELTGNGNGLCESGETCLYTPNIGAYQGHGSLISAGAFTNGTITGVTLMKYETNGY